MTLTALNRWKASALHLGLSAAIGLSVIALMLAVWYPQPYFAAMGGDTLILILIGVDVVIGPVITLIVFDPKKKSLKFDLAVIALLQLAALAYGCHVMFEARPVYNVFVVDRFEVVAANQVDDESLAKVTAPEFRTLPAHRSEDHRRAPARRRAAAGRHHHVGDERRRGPRESRGALRSLRAVSAQPQP